MKKIKVLKIRQLRNYYVIDMFNPKRITGKFEIVYMNTKGEIRRRTVPFIENRDYVYP